jgi:hypothetical protein
MQPLIESLGRQTDPIAIKAVADSLNKTQKVFLLTHDPVATGQFYNDYTYYFGVATMARMEMEDLKKKATNAIIFLKKEYDVENE